MLHCPAVWECADITIKPIRVKAIEIDLRFLMATSTLNDRFGIVRITLYTALADLKAMSNIYLYHWIKTLSCLKR